MPFTRRVREIADSATLVMSARAKAMRSSGIDVVNMSAGEPDFPTPPNVVEAAQAFLAEGQIKYTATPGIPELRSAAAARYAGMRSVPELRPENILVGCGGKHVIYTALQTICDDGDEVIFASPYWVSYPEMVKLAGGRPVVLPTRADQGFALDPEALRAAITPRSKAIIINTPSNPTGMRMDAASLEALAKIAVEHDLWILSDEIYDELCYAGEAYLSPISLGPEVRAHTLALNSFSKTYSMTGWRIGYAAGPVELIKAMSKVQAQSTSNACTLSQMAALEALTGNQSIVAERREAFAARRRRMVDGIRAIEGFSIAREPQGAFYVFPSTSDLYGSRLGEREINGSMDLSMALLEEAHVATVPGVAFGDDAHIRLSYAISDEQIDEGIKRIAAMVGRLER